MQPIEDYPCVSVGRKGFRISLGKFFIISVLLCGLSNLVVLELYFSKTREPKSFATPTSREQKNSHHPKKLATKYLSSCRKRESSRPWANSSNLPNYIVEYLDWHVETMCLLDHFRQLKQEPMDVKYFVVQCLPGYGPCGGLADRLAPLPYYILYAYKMKRILLIHWTIPFPLQEFLMPTPFGINWTVPDWLMPSMSTQNPAGPLKTFIQLTSSQTSNITFLRVKLQAPVDFLVTRYNEEIKNDFNDTLYTFKKIYHDLFHSIFTLVPPIQSLVLSQLNQLNLTPGNFTSVHVRARHPVSMVYNVSLRTKTFDKSGTGSAPLTQSSKLKMVNIIKSAMSCAALLDSGSTIFFSSDSHHAMNYTLHEYNATVTLSNSYTRIVGRDEQLEPLHFDEPEYMNRKPSDFYPVFVDLWLLSMSKCTVYGVGGYGRLSSILSYNSSCYISYYKNKLCASGETELPQVTGRNITQ